MYDLTMFTSQSGLDKLTAAIESALGGRGSSNTSGCSADENDINCSNGNENGGVADMTAKRGGGGAGSSVLRDAADGTSRKQNAYYEQVIMSAPGTGNTQPSGSSHGMPPGRAVGKHESHGAPRAHVMGATAEKARTATVSKGSSLSSRSSKILRMDFRSRYKLGATIGQGSFGKVKKATDTHRNTLVAIKLVNGRNFKRHEYEQFMNEVDVMTEIVHPNSIQLYAVYEYEPQLFAMVMELAEGGELFERIQNKGSFTEEEAAGIMRQLLSCLKFMHAPERKIAHRDLKPENILFVAPTDESCIKLTDYGFSKRVTSHTNFQGNDDHVFKTRLGSPNYVAPEILSSRHAPYGVEVDIWSLGVILYIMLCGYFPFYSENERELYKQIRSARYDFPEEEWAHVSDAAKDLVVSMLTLDPRLRATAADCLRHPWIARPGVPSRVPFPQKSIDRLRVFVEESNKRQNPLRHENGGRSDGAADAPELTDKFQTLVNKVLGPETYDGAAMKHNAIHPVVENQRSYQGSDGFGGVRSNDVSGAAEEGSHVHGKASKREVSQSFSTQTFLVRRSHPAMCGCALQ